MANVRYLAPVGILLTYLVAGLLYAALTPAWQAPDEPAHYNYIRYLATHLNFPELVAACYDQVYLNELTSRSFPSELPIDTVCYEFHQPPFYYLLATPVYMITGGSLIILRLLSIIFGAGVIGLTYFIGRTIFPGKFTVIHGAMAFVAFVPMHVAILSSVNNDALAELILAILLLLLVRRQALPAPASVRQNILLGFCLGLGLLTKTTVYIAIPLIAIALWLAEINNGNRYERRLTWMALLKQGGTIYGVALLMVLPWFMRNIVVYGDFDILGLKRHDAIVVGQLRTIEFLAEIGPVAYVNSFVLTTFRSFWGQFGWMAVPMDGRTYLLLTVVTLLAGGGLIMWLATAATPSKPGHDGASSFNSLPKSQRYMLTLLASTILLITAGYGWYNLSFVQFQGRYLFPGLIPLAIFFSIGLGEALSQRRFWWTAGSLLLALVWIIVASGLNGQLDKWAILMVGLALAWIMSQPWVVRFWPGSTVWLLIICYISLGLLTLAGPFWFVMPHL